MDKTLVKFTNEFLLKSSKGKSQLFFCFRKHFSVNGWESAAILAMWLSLIYLALEAPHRVHDHHSGSWFFGHALHKFAVLFVMIFALFHFRNY